MKTALRRLISSVTTAPTAFDLIERNGDDDLRRDPPEVRKTPSHLSWPRASSAS
jgi:hypothetical protein